MRIGAASVAELPTLRDIERAAGLAFRGIGMPEIADDEPPGLDELATYQRAGRCGRPVPPVRPAARARTSHGRW